MTKTCQNCKHYIAEMFHCQKNDVMAEAFNTCEDFEPKVITNGDRIRQGGDDALVEFKKKHKCDCCVYICNGNCTEPVDRKNRCDDGLKHWLNAPAESEGKMSKMCKNCRYFATTGSSSVCTLYCCATSDGENCRNYEVSTLFDSITESPEVLAPYLVSDDEWGFHSSITDEGEREDIGAYSTEEEAIAATVAKLKEVAE